VGRKAWLPADGTAEQAVQAVKVFGYQDQGGTPRKLAKSDWGDHWGKFTGTTDGAGRLAVPFKTPFLGGETSVVAIATGRLIFLVSSDATGFVVQTSPAAPGVSLTVDFTSRGY
jgi:hypothetical protein